SHKSPPTRTKSRAMARRCCEPLTDMVVLCPAGSAAPVPSRPAEDTVYLYVVSASTLVDASTASRGRSRDGAVGCFVVDVAQPASASAPQATKATPALPMRRVFIRPLR